VDGSCRRLCLDDEGRRPGDLAVPEPPSRAAGGSHRRDHFITKRKKTTHSTDPIQETAAIMWSRFIAGFRPLSPGGGGDSGAR
jgi:hypothetical protein